MDDEVTTLEGPLEKVNGRFTLRIPLKAGGSALIPSAKGISRVEGEFLHVVLPHWLVLRLGVRDGDRVRVDNEGGKLNINLLGRSNGELR